jgi:DNA-directed RNA polymerase subunit RPC12/RpoP
MSDVSIKFRCAECNKLLGAPASKAGRTITCPNCKSRLIVPDPLGEEETVFDGDLAAGVKNLIPNLDLTSPASPNLLDSKPTSSLDPSGAFSWDKVDVDVFKSLADATIMTQDGGAPLPEKFAPEFSPTEEMSLETIAIHRRANPVEVDLSQEIDRSTGEVPEVDVVLVPEPIGAARLRPSRSAGDLTISQAVLASWSLFVLLALAISFVAGLFVGHYVWK